MAERLLKWISFSILMAIFPVILSLILRKVFNLDINLSDYVSELLFMSVTLSATSIGDLFMLIKKGVNGFHITFILIILIFISLICMAVYEMESIGEILELTLNPTIVNLLTFVGCAASIIVGGLCQIFLGKIEGDD